MEIQLLGVNDFHGRLESPGAAPRDPGGPGSLGGAAALDAHLDRAARSHPGRTIRVHAGDMVGASPLLSSHFHDEPTVRAMNLMDFDVGTLGNHEFDEGGDELIRLLREREAPDVARGVGFPYIAANTVDREGELDLPPTRIIERAGVRVGFIGVTTTSTPNLVLDEHTERFDWLDISDDGEPVRGRPARARASRRSWCSPTPAPTTRTATRARLAARSSTRPAR